MSLFFRFVFNLTEIEAMRGDGGTLRGLGAQQTNSRAAGRTTNFRRAEPNSRMRNQDKKSTPSANAIAAGGSTQNNPSRQNQPAKKQTDGHRAKRIRRAIKKGGAENGPVARH